MTERHRRQHQGRHGRRRPLRLGNFYQRVLQEAEDGALDEAAAAPGLGDEVSVLRVLVRRHLEAHPENLDLTIKGLHLLVRMVVAQYRLSGEDAERFQEQCNEVIGQFAAQIFKEEARHA